MYACGAGSHGAHGLGNVGRVAEPKRIFQGLKDPQTGKCVYTLKGLGVRGKGGGGRVYSKCAPVFHPTEALRVEGLG